MKKYFNERKDKGKKQDEKYGASSCFEREQELVELFEERINRVNSVNLINQTDRTSQADRIIQTDGIIQTDRISQTDLENKDRRTFLAASIFVAFLFILTSSVQVIAAQDHILITQVYYDPVKTETGGEAIELYNPTDAAIDISQYVLKTKSSAVDATIPLGKSILPHQYFLFADTSWSINKDNESFPNADYEEAITLVNSDGGVALLFNGTVIDAVGYGNVTDVQLFEGTSAQMVAQGNVLQRINFSETDNNSFDFFASLPAFHNASFQENKTAGTESENAVVLLLNVTNTAPVVELVTIQDDDLISDNIQVQPIPGTNTTTNITVIVSDQNGFEDIKKVSGTFVLGKVPFTFVKKVTENSAEYVSSVNLPYYLAPEEYSFEVTVSDDQFNSSMNASFSYLTVTALSLDADSLFFQDGKPNGIITILGDLDFFSSTQPTVRNIGNTPLDIGVYGTALSNGKQIIPLQNIQFSFDNFKTDAHTATENVELYPGQVLPGDSAFQLLGLRLLVPNGLTTGIYSGKVAIVGAAS